MKRQKYNSMYRNAAERKQAKHNRIRMLFERLGNYCQTEDLINWLADRFYVSPEYISRKILKSK